MMPNAYRSMARHEVDHWYYRARRRAIRTLIDRYLEPRTRRLRIVDVGCGTGGTTALLAEFGEVIGVEPSELAIQLLRQRHPQLPVVEARVQDLPEVFPPGQFDLATVLGVLCHRGVPEPADALRAIHHVLRPGGFLLWGDCVYPCLARAHDLFVQAQRRFYPGQMHRMLAEAGFCVVATGPMLAWAFPLALLMAGLHRLKTRLWGRPAGPEHWQSTDDRPVPRPLNAALEWLTYWEWRLALAGWNVALGVSWLVLARKSASSALQVLARAAPAIQGIGDSARKTCAQTAQKTQPKTLS